MCNDPVPYFTLWMQSLSIFTSQPKYKLIISKTLHTKSLHICPERSNSDMIQMSLSSLITQAVCCSNIIYFKTWYIGRFMFCISSFYHCFGQEIQIDIYVHRVHLQKYFDWCYSSKKIIFEVRKQIISEIKVSHIYCNLSLKINCP